MKTFVFNHKVIQPSQDETTLFESLPESPLSASYTAAQKKVIESLYNKFIEKLKPGIYASYQKNQRWYNGRPTALQAKHNILGWYFTFINQGEMNNEEAADFFWSRLSSVDEMRELINLMYERTAYRNSR